MNSRVQGLSLKHKLQRQLCDTRIDGRAANDAERSGCEVGVGIRKLRMVQGVVELGPKEKAGFLARPIEGHRFRQCEIQICLPRPVYDTSRTVSKRCSYSV